MSRRIIVQDPHPISEVVGSVSFDGKTYELRRGLLATLDAARAVKASQLALATIQVAWYRETRGEVPVSCQRTLDLAKQAAA